MRRSRVLLAAATSAMGVIDALAVRMGAAKVMDNKGLPALGWRTRPARRVNQTSDGALERLNAAADKRTRRAAKVNAHMKAGAYGLNPLAGSKGYVPNYPLMRGAQ